MKKATTFQKGYGRGEKKVLGQDLPLNWTPNWRQLSWGNSWRMRPNAIPARSSPDDGLTLCWLDSQRIYKGYMQVEYVQRKKNICLTWFYKTIFTFNTWLCILFWGLSYASYWTITLLFFSQCIPPKRQPLGIVCNKAKIKCLLHL